MFRKPKRKQVKSTLRKKDDDDDDDNAYDVEKDEETSELVQEARKRIKSNDGESDTGTTNTKSTKHGVIMHTFQTKDPTVNARDLVTSTAEHHPENSNNNNNDNSNNNDDGIYRGDKEQRNKFHAGPIRAAQHVRVTARFDYQPDICKDYKETGFCGFGDTCIYLHDRGDTLTGWQLEQQYEQQMKEKQQRQQQEMLDYVEGKKLNDNNDKSSALISTEDDGIPFACFICREYFKYPVVTNCLHYFCERCIMDHVRNTTENCPICNKDTGSVFNEPTKLIIKKRKLLGSIKAKEKDSWEQYYLKFSQQQKVSDS